MRPLIQFVALHCFVFTGDPGARPRGRIDIVTNPDGLMSSWCGPAVVGKVWFARD
jgi:hypothetical protein